MKIRTQPLYDALNKETPAILINGKVPKKKIFKTQPLYDVLHKDKFNSSQQIPKPKTFMDRIWFALEDFASMF